MFQWIHQLLLLINWWKIVNGLNFTSYWSLHHWASEYPLNYWGVSFIKQWKRPNTAIHNKSATDLTNEKQNWSKWNQSTLKWHQKIKNLWSPTKQVFYSFLFHCMLVKPVFISNHRKPTSRAYQIIYLVIYTEYKICSSHNSSYKRI